MGTNVTRNGKTYTIPGYNDTGYSVGPTSLDQYLIDLATNAPSQNGGLFQLTGELDWGPNYGLKSISYKSRTVNPAASGVLRLAKTDLIAFRNNANGGDLTFGVDSSDFLKFGSSYVMTASGLGSSGQVLTSNGTGVAPTFQNVSGTGTVNSGTQYQLGYYATSTNAISGASSIVTDASGNLSVSGDATIAKTTSVNVIVNSTSNSPVIQLQRAATAKSRFGIADGASSLCTGTAAGDLVIRAEGQKMFFSADSGTTAALILDTSSNATFAQNATVTGTVDTATVTHSTGVAIKGTTTNGSAAAGNVGEVIESIVQSANASVSGQYEDFTSIALTAGDWLVSLQGRMSPAASQTVTEVQYGISPNSGNSFTGLVDGSNRWVQNGSFAIGGTPQANGAITNFHVQLASPTTYYYKTHVVWSGGSSNPNFAGRITAVRIR